MWKYFPKRLIWIMLSVSLFLIWNSSEFLAVWELWMPGLDIVGLHIAYFMSLLNFLETPAPLLLFPPHGRKAVPFSVCAFGRGRRRALDRERAPESPCRCRRERVRVLRVCGLLLASYIGGLFLNTHPLLITAFPLRATQEARLAPYPAHTRADSKGIRER